LIQRAIETIGITTVSISLVRAYSQKIKPPRAISLAWPFGHPLGEPGNMNQQAAVLGKAFEALYQINEPGTIIDVDWHWGMESYPPAPWLQNPSRCK
jgi:D-proline reductase (dithiol) PrdB